MSAAFVHGRDSLEIDETTHTSILGSFFEFGARKNQESIVHDADPEFSLRAVESVGRWISSSASNKTHSLSWNLLTFLVQTNHCRQP